MGHSAVCLHAACSLQRGRDCQHHHHHINWVSTKTYNTVRFFFFFYWFSNISKGSCCSRFTCLSFALSSSFILVVSLIRSPVWLYDCFSCSSHLFWVLQFDMQYAWSCLPYWCNHRLIYCSVFREHCSSWNSLTLNYDRTANRTLFEIRYLVAG